MSDRYPDRTKAGRSRLIPFRNGEAATDRHSRRLRENVAAAEELRAWCAEHGIDMTVTNGGHHWQFRLPTGQVAEWWPSRAKFVWDKQWAKGIHVHDHEQARKLLQKRLPEGSA